MGWSLALGAAGLALPACAETLNRAGEVIHFSPADERHQCVAFAGDQKAGDRSGISGMALLKSTGLEVITKSYGSMGEFVCKIDDVGSDVSDCPAKDGSYWAYFHLSQSGTWTSSNVGASSYRVHDGEVEGWSWQPLAKGTAPFPTSFGAICPGAAPESSPSPSPSPQSAPRGKQLSEPLSSSSKNAAAPASPSGSVTPSPSLAPDAILVTPEQAVASAPPPILSKGQHPSAQGGLRDSAARGSLKSWVGYLAVGLIALVLGVTRVVLVSRAKRS